MKKLSLLLFAFALLFGAKAFAQEWEYSYAHLGSDDETMGLCGAKELSDGRIAVNANFAFKSGAGDFYSYHPAMVLLDADGNRIACNDYFKPGYCSSNVPFVFENEEGELYALFSYSPDHDYTYFNYFKNYDVQPTDAIIGLYKLDNTLSVVESYEYSFPIDTFEVRTDEWSFLPNEYSGNVYVSSAVLDEGTIVGSYMKIVSYDYHNPRGQDSLFMFRMNFNGEILQKVGYEMTTSGAVVEFDFRNNHLVKTDSGFVYYVNYTGNLAVSKASSARLGSAIFFDKDLNYLKVKGLKHFDIDPTNCFYNISVKRSNHNTTYLSASSHKLGTEYDEDCRIYEYDDDIENTSSTLPILHYAESKSKEDEYDIPGMYKAVDAIDDNTIYWVTALNVGFWNDLDSYLEINRLNADFQREVSFFYDLEEGRMHSEVYEIDATNDGGALVVFKSHNLENTNERFGTVTKFPAEAFLSVEEAHANGLKVAIAYPNPGGSEMHIRTMVENATVEVYDMNGCLVAQQPVMETETVLDATDWASGEYVWKVVSGVSTLRQSSATAGSTTLVESGKWVKE